MSKGVESGYGGVTIARKWRIVVGQAVPEAESLEVNFDSARGDGGVDKEVRPFPPTGSIRFLFVSSESYYN